MPASDGSFGTAAVTVCRPERHRGNTRCARSLGGR
jgi:hypothetical protein